MARMLDGAKLTAGVMRRSMDSFLGLSAAGRGLRRRRLCGGERRATRRRPARRRGRARGPTSRTTTWSILFLGVGWHPPSYLVAAALSRRQAGLDASAHAGWHQVSPLIIPACPRPPLSSCRSSPVPRRTSPPTCSSRSSPRAPGPTPRLDPATGGALASLLGGTELRRKAFETAWLPVVARGAQASRVLVVGSGKRRGPDAGTLAPAGHRRRPGRPPAPVRPAGLPRARRRGPARGAPGPRRGRPSIRALDLDTYKTGDRDTTPLTRGADPRSRRRRRIWSPAVERGRILGEATNFARLMANEPGNVLTPRVFAERGAALAAGTVARRRRSTTSRRSRRSAWACIEGVARGCAEPARLLTLSHDAAGRHRTGRCSGWSARASPSTPAASRSSRPTCMDRMKDDMAGGAAVIARDARDRLLERADPRRRRRPDGREHAGRQGAEARRRDPRRQRQDGRSAQHRRRRAA